ncbi:unnamed protein product [Peronospora belbahrii]|uniref:WRKY19-like zinc finger domain-containing protein n=1 Tax=Peronospora belbahrii TaxID=622444 RepID=A0AAU9KSK2_9STRA|nr:unnamed protein product [Peronospora belbahrii]CAH0515438.1 unnamed protein product [Peronospora belbahrii]
MEWTKPRPCPQFTHPLQSQPWYHYDDEEEEKQEATLNTDQFGGCRVLLPQSASSLKTEYPGTLDNEGGAGMTSQSASQLHMPQLEEENEFQSFYSSQNFSFPDNTALPQSLPPLSSPPSHQQELQTSPQSQFGGPFAMQLTSQYSELPPDSASYYLRPISLPSTPMSMPEVATRTSADYFFEGIPTLHSTHNPMPTPPTSFGLLEQQQQLLLPPVLEDHNGNFDNSMTQEMTSTMFRSSMAPTEQCNSSRTMRTLSIDNYPAQSSVSSTAPAYSPAVAPRGRPKRGGGLREPFTDMATTHEPKFSPDKRKLCCVEGCTSQARAFNRCKRHGGSKRCSSPGCTKSVQSRGLCIRHGGGSRCQESGCTRASQSHGRCKLHGGGRPCIVEGCEKKAHLKRLCRKHGGGTKCCVTDCEKWSQRQGMCMTHSKVVSPQLSDIGIVSGSAPF